MLIFEEEGSCIAAASPHVQHQAEKNQVEQAETFSASTVSPFQLSPTVKSTLESLKLLLQAFGRMLCHEGSFHS